MSDFGDKLTQALDQRESDVNHWTWKLSNGSEIRMMDMNQQQIERAYKHVLEMLYNKDPYHPGVQRKRDQVRKMWDCANTELLLRYVLYECNIEGLRTNRDLLDFISNNKQQRGVKSTDYVTALFDGLPEVFTKITVDDLLSACLDSLVAFNRKLIPDKFILSLGLWLTEDEKKELTEFDSNGHFRNRKDVIKERLLLNNVDLRFSPRGLTYYEFRSLLKVEGHPKFSSMTTDVLRLLRDKVLLLLDQDFEYHINKWSVLKEKLEIIASQKDITLNSEC